MNPPRSLPCKYLILGSGPAGIAAAEAIRERDHYGNITLLSDDNQGYYSRPGLAYYLTGELPENFLYPFREQDFLRLNIRRVPGRAVHLEPERQKLLLQDGSSLTYERLLLAMGARAAKPDLPGIQSEGVVKLDSLSDAQHILRLARKARQAVVVGGGITALELVEGLSANRVKPHYFLRGERYWSNVLDETESRIVEQRLKHEGVSIHYHTEVREIKERRGKVVGVLTQDGKEIRCQLVAIAIGIQPRKELAAAAGLKIDRGILVNEYLQTSDPRIFAAGDVAQVFDPFTGRSVLDSLWGPAREQGATAGLNMYLAGNRDNLAPYCRKVPFNVTRLASLTTTIIGTVGSRSEDDLIGIARGDSETWRYIPDAIAAQTGFEVNRLRVLVGSQALAGAVVMGDQTLSQPLHHLIARQVDISAIRDELLAQGAPVADLIADFWAHYQGEKQNVPQKP